MAEETITGPRSALRLIAVLDAIAAEPDGVTLADLASAVASPKSSLLLILRPLVERGYLNHRDSRYRLGTEAFRLASAITARRSFPEVLRACMESLAEQTGETVYLAAIDKGACTSTYVEGIASQKPVRYWVPIGTSRPLYSSAAGLCLLAFQDVDWRDEYVRRTPLKPLTRRTQTDPDQLIRRLEEIRRDGLSFSVGEAVADASGMAAPIHNPDGSVTMSLLVAAPVLRFQEATEHLRRSVIVAAATASSAMGSSTDVAAPDGPVDATMEGRKLARRRAT
ncbi:MAG: IclR family transcriptional regulator [Amphiplicatus sp.]